VEYAHAKGKHIEPVRLEVGCDMYDGWLGQVCGDKQYYDLSDQKIYEMHWNALQTDLSKEMEIILNTTGLQVIFTMPGYPSVVYAVVICLSLCLSVTPIKASWSY